MGLVYKISLEWEVEGEGEGGGGWGEILPGTVVVKANPSNFRSAFASAMLESRREVVFYEKFEELFEARIRKVSAASSTEESLWSSVHNLIPRVYFSGGDAKTGGFCILMDDLSPKTVLAGHLFGNQCWGAVPLPEELAHVSHVEVLETLYLQMAKVHALFWQDKSLVLSPDQQWLKEGKWMKGTDRSTWEYAIQQSGDKWKVIQQQTQLKKQKGDGVVSWDPKLVAVTEAAIAKSNWEGFQKEWNILTAKNLPYFTLTHGDFHAGNMLWSKNPSLTNGAPFYLIDWPCAGCELLPLSSPSSLSLFSSTSHSHVLYLFLSSLSVLSFFAAFCPFTELAQFVISHVSIEDRREHEKRLLQAYYEELIRLLKLIRQKEGPSSESSSPLPSFEDCWDRYKSGGVERFIQLLIILASFNLPVPALQWFERQVSAFVIDHADSCRQQPITFKTAYSLP